MSSNYRPVTVAAPGTPCGWTTYSETGTKVTCHGDRAAIHVLTETLPVAKVGTALCGFHSPFDPTDAEREATRKVEAEDAGYDAWVARHADDPNVEIIGGHPYGRKSGLPIFRNLADNSPGILARRKREIDLAAIMAEGLPTPGNCAPGGYCFDGRCGGCADCVESAKVVEPAPGFDEAMAEAEVSGVEILADLLTLDAVPDTTERDRMVKFHKLSAPMIGVLTEVARSRGLVGAWAMRNVVVPGVERATMRTVAALRSRGLIGAQTNDGNQSGTGGLTDYVLTEAGYGVAEAIGCPVVDLPTETEAITVAVSSHTEADCETGCEVIIARGLALLPAGGDVCYGCGSVFTRPSGQLHPSLYVISETVVGRNQAKGI